MNLGSKEGGQFFNKVNYYQFKKKDSIPWREPVTCGRTNEMAQCGLNLRLYYL